MGSVVPWQCYPWEVTFKLKWSLWVGVVFLEEVTACGEEGLERRAEDWKAGGSCLRDRQAVLCWRLGRGPADTWGTWVPR